MFPNHYQCDFGYLQHYLQLEHPPVVFTFAIGDKSYQSITSTLIVISEVKSNTLSSAIQLSAPCHGLPPVLVTNSNTLPLPPQYQI